MPIDYLFMPEKEWQEFELEKIVGDKLKKEENQIFKKFLELNKERLKREFEKEQQNDNRS